MDEFPSDRSCRRLRLGGVKKSSEKSESSRHTSIISSSISVVNDKVVSLVECMSAVAETNNSTDEFNIEMMESMIHSRGEKEELSQSPEPLGR